MAVMNKFKRLGFLFEDVSFVHICKEQDHKLFTQILSCVASTASANKE